MAAQALSFSTTDTFSAERDSSNPSRAPSLKETLGGAHAFYRAADYETSTRRDFQVKEALPATYTWNTESKIIRIAKWILSIIIFPIAIYNLLHIFAAYVGILPAVTPDFVGTSLAEINGMRECLDLTDTWKYKRITIAVNGCAVDAMIVGKADTLDNGRWILATNGNGEFYEQKLLSPSFQALMTQTNSNAIVFNYPGVGCSSWPPGRHATANAYYGVRKFLEDPAQGIGASEIIPYGNSIGGAAQEDILRPHALNPKVKYVFVKVRTFSNLSAVASSLICSPLGATVRVLDWNMNPAASSENLEAAEIVMQTARVSACTLLTKPTDTHWLRDDRVIGADVSLASALLNSPQWLAKRHNKCIIGIPEDHYHPLSPETTVFLADKIEEYLAPSLNYRPRAAPEPKKPLTRENCPVQ